MIDEKNMPTNIWISNDNSMWSNKKTDIRYNIQYIRKDVHDKMIEDLENDLKDDHVVYDPFKPVMHGNNQNYYDSFKL